MPTPSKQTQDLVRTQKSLEQQIIQECEQQQELEDIKQWLRHPKIQVYPGRHHNPYPSIDMAHVYNYNHQQRSSHLLLPNIIRDSQTFNLPQQYQNQYQTFSGFLNNQLPQQHQSWSPQELVTTTPSQTASSVSTGLSPGPIQGACQYYANFCTIQNQQNPNLNTLSSSANSLSSHSNNQQQNLITTPQPNIQPNPNYNPNPNPTNSIEQWRKSESGNLSPQSYHQEFINKSPNGREINSELPAGNYSLISQAGSEQNSYNSLNNRQMINQQQNLITPPQPNIQPNPNYNPNLNPTISIEQWRKSESGNPSPQSYYHQEFINKSPNTSKITDLPSKYSLISQAGSEHNSFSSLNNRESKTLNQLQQEEQQQRQRNQQPQFQQQNQQVYKPYRVIYPVLPSEYWRAFTPSNQTSQSSIRLSSNQFQTPNNDQQIPPQQPSPQQQACCLPQQIFNPQEYCPCIQNYLKDMSARNPSQHLSFVQSLTPSVVNDFTESSKNLKDSVKESYESYQERMKLKALKKQLKYSTKYPPCSSAQRSRSASDNLQLKKQKNSTCNCTCNCPKIGVKGLNNMVNVSTQTDENIIAITQEDGVDVSIGIVTNNSEIYKLNNVSCTDYDPVDDQDNCNSKLGLSINLVGKNNDNVADNDNNIKTVTENVSFL